MTSTDVLVQQLINGLTQGMVYALIALGYTMVYGIIELINFAHGEIFMVGAFAGLLAAAALGAAGMPQLVLFAAAMAAALVCCGVLGVGLERAAYRPLRNAPRLAPLITAIGASFFLQNAVMVTLGSQPRSYPPLMPAVTFMVGGARVTLIQILILAVATLFMAGLQVFIRYTKAGRAIRACAQDRRAASLMGVNVDRVIAQTFLVGSVLAGAGGVLYGMRYGFADFFMGYIVGVKAFTSAVLGGIGNVPGAMLGGILLGLIESLGAGLISSQWKDVIAFGVLVLVLLIKPSGLLGERVADRA